MEQKAKNDVLKTNKTLSDVIDIDYLVSKIEADNINEHNYSLFVRFMSFFNGN